MSLANIKTTYLAFKQALIDDTDLTPEERIQVVGKATQDLRLIKSLIREKQDRQTRSNTDLQAEIAALRSRDTLADDQGQVAVPNG